MKTINSIFIKPIEKFINFEASSGIILMIMAVLAFYSANSSLSETYFSLVNLPISFSAGDYSITHTLVYWINDALMVLFFFVVGLEIKKEMIDGELNSRKKAALPIIAAFGGAIVPSIIYMLFNFNHPENSHGWGIPMATDIAFAVGVLALFGKCVPVQLKIFLLALAIVDDLIAVLVIAIFYTEKISPMALVSAGLIFAVTEILKRSHVNNYVVYFFLGLAAWVAVFASGVHATIAGVLLGLITPLKTSDGSINPVQDLIHFFHPWVAFMVMPIFAFFNAGVKLDTSAIGESLSHPIALGVAVGLILGKPIGIYFSVGLAKRLDWISLPQGLKMTSILPIGFLGGIGFTMALFVASLSFKDPSLEAYAKIGILLASLISAILGLVTLHFATKSKVTPT
jgi:Na+:H+ antiporter, NhaA family